MLAQAHTAREPQRLQRPERGQAGKQGEELCESRGSEGWVLPSIQTRPCGSADTSAFGSMTHQSGGPIPGAWRDPCDCDRAVCHWVEALLPENVSWRTVTQKAGEMLRTTAPGTRGVPLSVTSGVSSSAHKRLMSTFQRTLGPIHSFVVTCHLTMRSSLGNVITAQVS